MPSMNARVSEKKQIIDQAKHTRLQPEYLRVLENLERRYAVQIDEDYEKLVNFKSNKNQPIHRWFDYKQGYAQGLVQKIIDYSELAPDDYVLDPFTGVGTTQVVAQMNNIKSIGIDINPVANFAARVKTHIYTTEEISQIERLLQSIRHEYKKTTHVPKYQKLKDIFTESQLEQILSIKGFYESIENKHVRGFFKLAYLSVIEPVSNRTKDGNGIKISRSKHLVKDVYKYYEDKVITMLGDIELSKPKTNADIIDGSLLQDEVYNEVKKHNIDAVIYSPPYANCFDYLEVYKMEVWLGDFVADYEDFSDYRNLAIRSHVNSRFDHIIRNTNDKVDTIADFIGTYNVWNKNIPAMIKGYFDDMTEIIKRSYAVSRHGALCAIVVANSGYKGVIVPTDLLLVEIAENAGYKLDKIIHARNIRSSSQQMVELQKKNGLMRESIILLRK